MRPDGVLVMQRSMEALDDALGGRLGVRYLVLTIRTAIGLSGLR